MNSRSIFAGRYRGKFLLFCFFITVQVNAGGFYYGRQLSLPGNLTTPLSYERPSIREMKAYQVPDSEDCSKNKKRFWRAATEWSLMQILPWSYNKFVRKAEFANISWESIKYNLNFDHWEWDDNSFNTNQFAHPYHGSLYFSSFRTNGYNFWQSSAASLVGSYVWEVAGETHPPAPNDWINTTLGGISLGSMTFRVANMIVDNTQTGFGRQVHEVLGFIINPLNGLNRILDGKWGRYCKNNPEFKPSVLNGNFDMGFRRYATNFNDVANKGEREAFLRASFVYGDPFKDRITPFSAFTLALEIGESDTSLLNRVYVNGVLQGWEVKETEKATHIFVATLNYDYIRHIAFQYGGQSFTGTLLSKFILSPKATLNTELGAIGVAIAAVPDPYLLYGEGRNYDFGPGAGGLITAALNVKEKFRLAVGYNNVWFHTVSGNASNHFMQNFTFEPRFFINKGVTLGVVYGYRSLISNYVDFEDVHYHYHYLKLFVGFRIGGNQVNSNN